MRTIKYQLTNITLDGKACVAKDGQPLVKFEEISPCVTITCIHPNNVIELSIDDSQPDCKKCFRYIIECAGCNNCEPFIQDVCLCDENQTCPPCFICDPLTGKCIPKCPEGVCDPITGDCGECNEEKPCPCNQQCVRGNCVCPQGKKKDAEGCCVDCLPGDIHPENKCLECVGGKWEGKICVDGACDPDTGDCNECVSKSDCKKDNQCCEGGKCICCPGYVLDPISKECVPKPKCKDKNDCPKCHECVNGDCQKIICPEGFSPVWNESKGICECLPKCDCDKPNCQGRNDTCVDRDKDGQCNCYDCGNAPCSTTMPCPEGCKCTENNICVKDNCGNPCTNGTQCPPGCGCKESAGVSICVDCITNPDALGCKDNCSGDCIGKGDCTEPCTCYEGECVDCSNFPCFDGSCAERPECMCDANGKCVYNPKNCKDTFTKSVTPCDITATLKMEKGCACPLITALVYPMVVTSSATIPPPGTPHIKNNKVSFTFAIRLVKGKALGWDMAKELPRLSDTNNKNIAHNEVPKSGVITVKVTSQIQNYIITNGVPVPSTVSTRIDKEEAITFANIDQDFVSNVNLEKINVYYEIDSTSGYKVLSRDIETKVTSKLEFPNNCIYEPELIQQSPLFQAKFNQIYDDYKLMGDLYDKYHFGGVTPANYDLSTSINLFKSLSSESSRFPLFKWSRSKDNNHTAEDIIRKVYKSGNGTYVDTLYGPKLFDPLYKEILANNEGRLLGGMYYSVENDCSCKDKMVDFGLITFCDPKNPLEGKYEFIQCNTEFKIISNFIPCDVNQDLHKFINSSNPDYALIDEQQAEYRLYLNGQKVNTFIDKEGMGMISSTGTSMIGSYFLSGKPEITSAELRLAYGKNSTQEYCRWKYIPTPKLQLEWDPVGECDNAGWTVYTIPSMVNTISIIDVTTNNPNVLITKSNNWTVRINKDILTPPIISIKYGTSASNCTRDYILPLKDCCSKTQSLIKVELNSSQKTVTFKWLGNPPVPTSQIILDSTDPNNPLVNPVSLNVPQVIVPGIIYDWYGTINGCNVRGTVILQESIPIIISVSPLNQSICQGSLSQQIVVSHPALANGSIKYKKDGVLLTGLVDVNGIFTIPPQSTASTFEFIEATVGSNIYPINKIATIVVVNKASAALQSGITVIYAGESTTLVLTGTIGATVTLSNGLQVNLDESPKEITVSPTTTTTYSITNVSFGNCGGVFTGTHTVEVNNPITIEQTNVCDGFGYRVYTFTSSVPGGTWKYYSDANHTIEITGSGNTVTVNPNYVATLYVVYTPPSGSPVNKDYAISSCSCPPITFDLTSTPPSVCSVETVTVTVSNIIGGSAPYYYTFIVNGVNTGETSNNTKAINITQTTTVEVTVRDGNSGCISDPQVISIPKYDAPVPNITSNDLNVTTLGDGNFEVCDDSTSALFQTTSFNSINWSIQGSSQDLTGFTNQTTVNIDSSLFSGSSATLQLIVTNAQGCNGMIVKTITKVPCNILNPDEVFIITSTNALYKVQIQDSPLQLGLATSICATLPDDGDITMSGNKLYMFRGGNLTTQLMYEINIADCTRIAISGSGINNGLSTVNADLGELASGELVYSNYDSLNNKINIYKYNVNTNTHSLLISTASPIGGSTITSCNGDICKLGGYLYVSGISVNDGVNTKYHLYRFTISGSTLINPTDLGVISDTGGANENGGFGLFALNGNLYAVNSNGLTHQVNLTTPNTSINMGRLQTAPGVYLSGSVYGSANNLQ